LCGRSVLVVEDEPLIALDLEQSLHEAGAKVLPACTLDRALQLVDHAGLSAAILDYGLSAGNCGPVCERLAQRRIPFVIYSGYPDLKEKFPNAVIVSKPAALTDVVDALSTLLRVPFLRRPSRREADHARR
jgi:DNA-binding response OmpR family regulator